MVRPPTQLSAEIRGASVSPDGRFFEVHTSAELKIIDAAGGRTVSSLPAEVIQPCSELGYERGFRITFEWAGDFLTIATGCSYFGGGIRCFSHRVVEVFDDRSVTPAHLAAFVQALTGTALAPDGTLTSADRFATMRKLQAGPLPPRFSQFVRWAFTPPGKRTISPSSAVSEVGYSDSSCEQATD